ncbi:transcriptional regulator [Streptomyces sp. CHA1]|uniref:transcriptional regulator n=1 Tax=Streptomyces TaxID=1883 RepID=UPI001BFC3C6B|nr:MULTISPECIES: transcriptional regulator [unclassified Streptomyces]UUD71342.1 transcriptional regulator [Streptomyces sp. G11C(2021)]MBT3159056.1 transcriptional regulator [Streptomyces sp. G11C]MCO6704376.1 transcriptional regulator [Streptomyces sp. CHB9.2]MCO6710645.1 transcriptional regulator [Streptomyces sp. CHA3]MCO6716446.1 transcriptional regulator [Streptomyces sp. CHB19.2]
MVLVDSATGEEVEPVVLDARTGRRLDNSEAYVFTAGPAAGAAMRGGRYEESGRA